MHFSFSNNTQTTLGVGLGTCQDGEKKDFYARTVSGCQQFQNSGSSDWRAPHSVAWKDNSKKQSTEGN